jgi:hypothetical protein
MIDRHVEHGETLLLITSADIQLPDDAMKGLTARSCSFHFHDAGDSMGDCGQKVTIGRKRKVHC